MMEFRDLRKQYEILRERMDAAVREVMASGVFIGGAPVAELEAELAEYAGVKNVITCANGTDALSIALKVWGIGPGDAVFVPDFTFFSTAETVAAEGAAPVFVDVLRETFNMDPEDLGRKVEAVLAEGRLRPRAVAVVDLFGQPADYARIRPLASKYGLYVLEDGAQGFGGSITSGSAGRRMNCSFGDMSTTSFFPAKPLGCYGDGGAIFTDNDQWAASASSIKIHGKGSCKYDNVRLGMNSRLDTLQAAVLKVKLDAFREYEVEAVGRAAEMYSRLLGEEVAVPFVPEGFSSSWAQYTVRLRDRQQRDRVQNALREAGIPSNVYYPKGMHSQTVFTGCRSYGSCPVTEELCGTVLSLPMHPYITEEEISRICSTLLSSVRRDI